jgi:hypothetical protein
MTTNGGASPRRVACPVCKGASVYAPSNPWRPFCSERCRRVDLGAWASEGYRVATQGPADDNEDNGPPPR